MGALLVYEVTKWQHAPMNETLLIGILVLLLAIVAVQNAAWLLEKCARRLRARRRARRARAGELEAEAVLQRLGYRVVDRQPATTWSVRLDADVIPIDVRADLLVSRSGRQYIAEVKTGNKAPEIRTAATRRQLLEYLHAYPVDGVLLVDMAEKRVHELDFGTVARETRRPLSQLAVAFALGSIGGIILVLALS